MSRSHILSCALFCFATPGFAELTAEDVWNDRIALAESLGAELSGTTDREGNMFFVNDVRLHYTLPLEIGHIRMNGAPMTMVDQEDGSVSIIYPKQMTHLFELDISVRDFPPINISANSSFSELTTTATGTEGQISYVQTSGPYSSTLDVDLLFEYPPQIRMEIEGDGYTNEYTVNRDGSTNIRGSATMGAYAFQTETSIDSGTVQRDRSAYGPSTMQTHFHLPDTPLDLLNLAPALRDGLMLEVSQFFESSSAEQAEIIDQLIDYAFAQDCGPANSAIRIAEDGFQLSADVEDCAFDFTITEWLAQRTDPQTFSVSTNNIVFNTDFPLLQSDVASEARLQLGIGDLTLPDNLWDLLDAQNALPRDEINMNIDVSANIAHRIEWLDVMGLETAMFITPSPVEVDSVTIDALDVSAVGASVATNGAFDIDFTDTETLDGFPLVVGAAKVALTGVHALLDNIEEAGFIDAQAVAMPRLMIGMFTRDDGNGTLTTDVEINETGEIRMNGERVK
ncbi:hypothetical protein [Loktanella sp. S4079]|uniref:hypothetical protein n=1 Tax=Loktanella sp. S4079 TaxID=579483 RepID=UPI0005FA3A23|nr:hypothetical protein [Loktanella sp. S4079]KJZ19301.1 hypothetical protein TW80_10980 [Loktanella sp. S4079]